MSLQVKKLSFSNILCAKRGRMDSKCRTDHCCNDVLIVRFIKEMLVLYTDYRQKVTFEPTSHHNNVNDQRTGIDSLTFHLV